VTDNPSANVLTVLPRMLRQTLRTAEPPDPTPVVDQWVDTFSRMTARVIAHQASMTKQVVGASIFMQRAVVKETRNAAVDTADQFRSLFGLFREQAKEVEQSAAERIAEAEREARRIERQAIRDRRDELTAIYATWTKADLQEELSRRELLRSGTVEELRERLIEDDMAAD
jgi:hypothetical protein